jgi:DNA-binding CsgD family transcriptional regulator
MSVIRPSILCVLHISGSGLISPNIPPFPRGFDPQKYLKTTTDWVMAGNQIVFSSPSEIPAKFADGRRFVERYGPKASAIIPMWAGNRVIGAASFGKFRAAREWPTKLLEQLTLAVRLFGSAIERKQAEAERRATLAQLRVASRRNVMSELVASLSHEINQPLGAIIRGAELTRMRWAEHVHRIELESRLGALTPREREVFDLVTRGLLNKQVGAELGTTERTVKAHRERVMIKMKADSLAGLVRMSGTLEPQFKRTRFGHMGFP